MKIYQIIELLPTFKHKFQLSEVISWEPIKIRSWGFHQIKVRCVPYIKVFAFIFAFRGHLHGKNDVWKCSLFFVNSLVSFIFSCRVFSHVSKCCLQKIPEIIEFQGTRIFWNRESYSIHKNAFSPHSIGRCI